MINHVFDEEVGKILLLVQQSSKCMYMPYQAHTWGGGRYKRKEIPLASGPRQVHRTRDMPWVFL